MYYVKLIPGIKKLLRRCTTMDVGIKGFGAYAPEKVVENAYFETTFSGAYAPKPLIPTSIVVHLLNNYAPEKVVENAYFETFLETSDEWISKMTGIKQRRWADEDEETSDLAYQASVRAIKDAGIEPTDIDMIIVATSTGDFPFPTV